MKSLFIILAFTFYFLPNSTFSQEKNIETQSVEIENLISFVVENYKKKEEGDSGIYNLIFLIQVSENGYSLEDEVVLKQGFKLLSKRLTEDDSISIIGYSGLNGVALEEESIKNLKKILYTLNNFKSSIKEFHPDGISLAYDYVNENFKEEAVNKVIMIRMPNSQNTAKTQNVSTVKKKKKNNAIVLTAITLLPEIISVLKD
ncbi:hypothetical protein DIS18_09485 [Algibacter marinivivus]|uniref:VWFA domain-containing protein n=1 Tax=Algibacter marinivivus TaxID=2100723 RepID=A0A2U2X3W5_9FLAO|nr:hypothetical protein [Algibacter marinivivus]PWH82475.1 hypothetical protein DIS18_09485 [Algibacter marinivivus]